MSEPDAKSRIGRVLGAAFLLLAGLGAYGAVAFNTLRNGRTTFEEVGYLIRSWWYATGTVAPYTATDATGHMPLYFYGLGGWQMLAGVGHVPGRLLSVGLGVVGAVLLFAICRRLTANLIAAAAAVAIFLATPATAYAFAMATPAALVSTLHLAAIWLVVSSLGRPRTWATVAFALLCVAIYFTRQNMIVGLVVLAPLYIAAIGRERRVHAGVLAAVIVIATATILAVAPDRLAAQALNLPVIAPTLARWGLLPPDFALIEQGSAGVGTMAPAFAAIRWDQLIDSLVLPYAGLLVAALALFVVTGRALRVLWIAPLYFFWLIAAHVAASAGYCAGCMSGYTPYFAATGALAAALTLATVASLARRGAVPAGAVIVLGAVLTVAISTFAPILARSDAFRYYPASRFAQAAGDSEIGDMDLFARWLKATAPPREPVLLIHDRPTVPYAAFLAGATFPVQTIDPAATRRAIRPRLAGPTREAVQAAIEAQSLWTDDTLKRWLQRDYELVLVQAMPGDQSAVATELSQRFDVIGSQPFRGQAMTLYRRKAQQ
jgi:hypothetical protein